MDVDELLLLRLGLLGLLLVFILLVGLSMSGAVKLRGTGGGAPAAASRARGASLQVVGPAESGIAPGTAYELAGVMTIGRSGDNSIVIVDPSVSSVHAEVRRVRGAWVIVDLDSTNGTLVGDRPVDGRGQSLRPGDRVTVGAVVLRYQA